MRVGTFGSGDKSRSSKNQGLSASQSLPFIVSPPHHLFHYSFGVRKCIWMYLRGTLLGTGKNGRGENRRDGERVCSSSSSPTTHIISTLSCPSVYLSV